MLRRALGTAGVQRDAEREVALQTLVAAQLGHWRQQPPVQGSQALDQLQRLNASEPSIVVFELQGGQVDVWRKSSFRHLPESETGERRMFRKRLNHYRTLLSEVLRLWPSTRPSRLVMDLRDIPMCCDEWPIFGFQRHVRANNLLLPDVDFFHHGWYLNDSDPVPYDVKSNSACFVGASTGAPLSADAVRRHASPRLRLAHAFAGDEQVVFKIAHAAHCDTEETRQLLISQPYFSTPVAWTEQLKHRFLLSVDGNGATCSRVVKSLRSQGVLVKFRSEQELYYFPLMQAGRHFLDVGEASQVRQILRTEAQEPGHHLAVATAGQAFAARYLSAAGVLDYTRLMLEQYAALLHEVGAFRPGH